jgi:hypothetical protein
MFLEARMRVADTLSTLESAPSARGSELTLNELNGIIDALSEVPRLDQIKEWFAALALRHRDYERYRLFAARKYARNLVASGRRHLPDANCKRADNVPGVQVCRE